MDSVGAASHTVHMPPALAATGTRASSTSRRVRSRRLRRALGNWMIALGLLGVPIASMLVTGGFHTFGFWFGSWLQLAMWGMWGSVLALPMTIVLTALTI